jgi:hypothetical protein
MEVFDKTNRGYLRYPYRTIGQLYFTIPGEGVFRCTAAVGLKRWVWTAGHCVYTQGVGWHTDFTFVPGARDDKTPFGVWAGDGAAAAPVGWIDHGSICHDIGAVRFETDSSGRTLQQRVGRLGFAANLPDQQHWNEFGYPAAAPFDGDRLIQSQSSIAEVDLIPVLFDWCTGSEDDPLTQGVGSDMTPGTSGGPWIVKLSGNRKGGNYINGVNSYKYIGYDESMYGPYFGDAAIELWKTMKTNP